MLKGSLSLEKTEENTSSTIVNWGDSSDLKRDTAIVTLQNNVVFSFDMTQNQLHFYSFRLHGFTIFEIINWPSFTKALLRFCCFLSRKALRNISKGTITLFLHVSGMFLVNKRNKTVLAYDMNCKNETYKRSHYYMEHDQLILPVCLVLPFTMQTSTLAQLSAFFTFFKC